MMHTYKSDENKIFLCRVADGGQFCISLHQQLRLPSADNSESYREGIFRWKPFTAAQGRLCCTAWSPLLDNLLSFLLIRISLALADGRKKATEPPPVLCTKVIQIWSYSSQGTHNMSKAIALLLELAKAGSFLFLYSYIHIPEKMTHGILLAQQ